MVTGPVLNSGSYQVCVETPNAGHSLCAGQTVCRDVDLNGFIDPTAITFILVPSQSLTPPSDASISCNDCSDVECTGVPTQSTCGSNSGTLITHEDVSTPQGCVRTITRTFYAGAEGTVVQRIIITDDESPAITTQASSQSPNCGNINPTFQQWLDTFGGATWTDCSPFTVTNDARGVFSCGVRTVTFLATDACGNLPTPTTATYSLIDSIAPIFIVNPSSSSVPCDASGGSDFAAFNAWLNSNGGAIAIDNCGTPTISNNYISASIRRGCNQAQQVIFTATDSCGLTATASSSFTITDGTPPRIINEASNPTVVCDGTQNVQFQSWLSNHGNLVATDACTATNSLTVNVTVV